jgi:hypothetical protein
MFGVVKLFSVVGTMAGEGAVATTVTLSGYSNVVEGFAARKRVNNLLHVVDLGQGGIILMFCRCEFPMTKRFIHDRGLWSGIKLRQASITCGQEDERMGRGG